MTRQQLEEFADYIDAVVRNLVATGATGAMLWSFADYDRALSERVCKSSSFTAAQALAVHNNDRARAQGYAEWADSCKSNTGAR